MSSEEKIKVIECNCKTFGDDDRANLKEIESLTLTVTNTNVVDSKPTEMNVSGLICSVCDRIELSLGSFMAICKLYSEPVNGASHYTHCEMLSKVHVEDRTKKVRYDGFKLFLSGKSGVI